MSKNLPLIHLFKEMDKFYFYDVNKNKVVKVSQEIFNLLQKELKTGETVSNKSLDTLRSKGYLSHNRVEEIVHPVDSILEDVLKNKLMKICLQVTQQCNFRCTYCVYSGEYENRGHSIKRMNWETAKKGIDFLIKHSKDSPEINVSFYGGEPLLQYELIDKCMKYATKVAEGRDISFGMTTNGSLLTEEMVENFLKYNMSLSVSLDGPKDIHDKNRKFARDGSATFDTVYNNLIEIFRKYPEFKNRLKLAMVIDPTIEVGCLNEFISADELFNDTFFSANMISSLNRKDKVDRDANFRTMWEYNRFKYFLYLLGKIPDQKDVHLLTASSANLLEFISQSNKSFSQLGKKDHHAGPCVPGQVRLFMNCDGDFFPCERVNESSKIMNLGNVDKGFYIEKIRKMLNIGKLSERECKNCFAFRGCYSCVAMADTGNNLDDELSSELKIKACKNIQHNFEEMLKDACTLKEFGLTYESCHVVKNF